MCFKFKFFFMMLTMLVAMSLPQVASAKNDDVTAIQELYAKILANINSGSIYHNQYVINKDNASWRAVGHFQETIDVYYNDCMVIDDEIPIMKINVKGRAATTPYSTEFLFNNRGELVFIHHATTIDESKRIDRRYYYKSGRLIRYIQGEKISASIPPEDSAELVREDAETLYKKGMAIGAFSRHYL